MAFKWKERYKLGIEEIDRQHKNLFDIGARVYDLAVLKDSYDHYDEIISVLNELLDYTRYHFTYEEELIKKHGYDGLEEQQKGHEFYVEKIKSIASKDIDSDQYKTIIELVDFLSEWISSHILLMDRKYAMYFKEKGIVV